MLRKLKNGETWTVEEMQEEQLYFLVAGQDVASRIVHGGTSKVYFAKELAEAILGEKVAELEKENLDLKVQLDKWTRNQGGRKRKCVDAAELVKWKKCGKSNREIGKILDISEGTVRNVLKRNKSPL
jgi:predicted transcriptional regulator